MEGVAWLVAGVAIGVVLEAALGSNSTGEDWVVIEQMYERKLDEERMKKIFWRKTAIDRGRALKQIEGSKKREVPDEQPW